jgi:hypothetical protein
MECPSPDGSGYPFYAELVSVSLDGERVEVEMLKRVQHKKIVAYSRFPAPKKKDKKKGQTLKVYP